MLNQSSRPMMALALAGALATFNNPRSVGVPRLRRRHISTSVNYWGKPPSNGARERYRRVGQRLGFCGQRAIEEGERYLRNHNRYIERAA